MFVLQPNECGDSMCKQKKTELEEKNWCSLSWAFMKKNITLANNVDWVSIAYVYVLCGCLQ